VSEWYAEARKRTCRRKGVWAERSMPLAAGGGGEGERVRREGRGERERVWREERAGGERCGLREREREPRGEADIVAARGEAEVAYEVKGSSAT
jgi:hypothetical protein